MIRRLPLVALTSAALVLTACASGGDSSDTPAATSSTSNAGKTITLWLAGGDTPDELRTYLADTFKAKTGATLKIEEQAWPDLVTKLTTALPDAENTPDVVELGNTQSPTFTNVGAFLDISDQYDALGGDKLLQSFVEAGSVDGKKYALPYYFGSRYMFMRKDVWKEAGVNTPTTLDEFNAAVTKVAQQNPRHIKDFSGFFIGGQDWRNGISWIFANGGDLAKKDGDKWVSTLSDPSSIKGLEQFQDLFTNASTAPVTEADSTPWVNINNDKNGNPPTAATIIAPGWAHWSIGDYKGDKTKDDGTTVEVREWNDATFGVFPLPGTQEGTVAPVFAGGSNIGISAKSTHQAGAKELMRIIFSPEYQQMLGKNGLGPANKKYVTSLGDDQFAKALIDSALGSKLTPAAPGWAAVEGKKILEEFFGKVAAGGDIKSLAKEYDQKIDAIING